MTDEEINFYATADRSKAIDKGIDLVRSDSDADLAQVLTTLRESVESETPVLITAHQYTIVWAAMQIFVPAVCGAILKLDEERGGTAAES